MSQKETKKEKEKEEKQVLYELVNKSQYKKHTIIGALSNAGLLNQYEKEEKQYGKYNIPATITQSELQNIITNYLEGK